MRAFQHTVKEALSVCVRIVTEPVQVVKYRK